MWVEGGRDCVGGTLGVVRMRHVPSPHAACTMARCSALFARRLFSIIAFGKSGYWNLVDSIILILMWSFVQEALRFLAVHATDERG